jgi:hypothetical protein
LPRLSGCGSQDTVVATPSMDSAELVGWPQNWLLLASLTDWANSRFCATSVGIAVD